ncbi:hypothetical protein Tco_0175159 [Tanacetum coccineum]
MERSRVTTRTPEKLVCRRTYQSLSEHPKDKSGIDASTKLTRAKLNKRSVDADLSKDKSGPELPLEFRRSWYVEGHIKSRVISSVLMQRYLRVTRQRHGYAVSSLMDMSYWSSE